MVILRFEKIFWKDKVKEEKGFGKLKKNQIKLKRLLHIL